jgi:hypothetical protein
MALRIETFDNARGGNTLYKALSHPCAAAPARKLLDRLSQAGPVAIYDPDGVVAAFAELYPLDRLDIAGVYVQDIAQIGRLVLGRPAQPATALADSGATVVWVAVFDAARTLAQLEPCLPADVECLTLDDIRIPQERLTNLRTYLDPLNFATNFVFFRDAGGLHTRLTTANYWAAYSAGPVRLWLTLFDSDGAVIAEWSEACGPPGAALCLDSREVRARFGLPEFAGQLFLHVVGAAGHDVVKYALDTFGEGALSATHDANAWPAEHYAGLPAPDAGERVLLWLQNSHPAPIPAGAVALNPMGEEWTAPINEPIAPFASRAVDVGAYLPGLVWPRQIEIRAGKHMVRPRYEVIAGKRRRIAHVNVERGDLKPDADLPRISDLLGKGYLLPAPILPYPEWRTLALPTPMALTQSELPIEALVYDPDGREVLRKPLGLVPRAHATLLDIDEFSAIERLAEGYGHLELVYDFTVGDAADGWLHALFRYRHRRSGHTAETSFGAHVFNTLLTYRGEPQSYSGRPPGLSTRLFLRLGENGLDTLCHLIYPASLPRREASATDLILHDRNGGEIARKRLAIPCSGSRLWSYREIFDAATRDRAGAGAYVIIRDTTCRLFGYHGLIDDDGAFSFDHMFGF